MLASAAGVVLPVSVDKRGYGNYVDLDHGDGLVTRYAHLSKVLVKPHQQVAVGAQLGLTGATGWISRPGFAHLHYEQRHNGAAVRASFDGAGALYFGTRNYQSDNACGGSAGVAGRVDTAGAPLTVRAGASTSTAAIGSIADGTHVTIRCQQRGQAITGTYGTSTLWDDIGNGFIADAYVATGSDGQVAPTCR